MVDLRESPEVSRREPSYPLGHRGEPVDMGLHMEERSAMSKDTQQTEYA